VAGRSPPSRWSCSSTFGALRTRSGSREISSAMSSGTAPSCQPRSPMRTFSTVEEIESAVGEEIGTTEWVEITQDRVDRFADTTNNHPWIYADRERVSH